MDLSRTLTKVFSGFFRANIKDLVVYCHRPDADSLWHWVVTASFSYNGARIRGGSVDCNISAAIVKSLSECGEAIVTFDEGFDARCGYAGGVFKDTASVRAKRELLERDAFLFHYRKNIPFTRIERRLGPNHPCFYFRMETRDENLIAVFATDRRAIEGVDGCLWFGASCDADLHQSIKKAYSEYAGIHFNHRRGSDRCRRDFESLEALLPAFERHHASSHDPRNRERIKSICSGNSERVLRQLIKSSDWLIKEKHSPIRGFQYVRASHPELEELEFGVPEPWVEGDRPLYHPYY